MQRLLLWGRFLTFLVSGLVILLIILWNLMGALAMLLFILDLLDIYPLQKFN